MTEHTDYLKEIEKKLLITAGITLPVITVRLDLKFYSLSLFMISLLIFTLYSIKKDRTMISKLFKVGLSIENIIIFLVLINMLFSTIYSINQSYGLQRLIKMVAVIFFYHIIVVVFSKRSYRIGIILDACVKFTPFYIMYFAYYYLFLFNVDYIGIITSYPTRTGKNALAFMLSIVMPFIIVEIFDYKVKSIRGYFWKISGLFSIFSVLFIQSRGLFLVMLLYLLVYFLLSTSKLKPLFKFGIIFLIIVLVFLYVLPKETQFAITNRFSSLDVLLQSDSDLEDLSMSRSSMIDKGLEMFWKNPIFGSGFGSFMFYGGIKTHISHNDYLLVLSEQGILGLTFFMALIMKFIHTGYHNYKISNATIDKGLYMSTIGITAYFLLINAYDNILVWTIFAFITCRKIDLRNTVSMNTIFDKSEQRINLERRL